MADSSSPPAEAHPGFLRAENPADAYLLAHGRRSSGCSPSTSSKPSTPSPQTSNPLHALLVEFRDHHIIRASTLPPPSHLQPPEKRDQQEWIWIAFDPDQLELILAQIDSL
ncbi:hypothetical protein PtA15_1A457 [Puccinia triticina]|uniref:Uncharacterized protein n=1 Tax=Puccinia triticina TaxID=208348 RepID=A0ABY7C9R6_9BASI|nr:uncharacterized protein PtA15_1A457 [Puccinia triticina]WAQ81118.1 hypothetical protein PtA15_1A457 [Puccinia triticina]